MDCNFTAHPSGSCSSKDTRSNLEEAVARHQHSVSKKSVAQRHILGVGTAVAWLTGSCQDKGETQVREDLELSKNKRR